MKKNFLKGAGLLTLATFFAKIIGAFYRIPLTNIIGAEGMGVYQLIFPVYSFLLSSSSGALPIAISILISRKLVENKLGEARELLSSAMSALLMTGILISIALVGFSGAISRLQGSGQAQLGYIAIAPAVYFVSGIAVLRGWFQGNGSMFPSALSQITEAAVKLATGLTLAWLLLGYGVKWAVFGALIGVTASEAVTFVTLYIIFRKQNPPFRLSLNYRESRAKYKEIMKISLPITLGGMILPVTQIIDSLLVVNILSRSVSEAAATASYGIYTGYVNTLINLPIVLTLSLGIAVIPQLGKGRAERNIFDVKQKSDTAVKLALVIGVPFAIFYMSMPRGILHILYPALSGAQMEEAAMLLRIEALSVVALSVTQIYTSILQGLENSYRPVRNMLFGAVLKTALNVILLPTIGIYGVAAASLACFILTSILNSYTVLRLMGKSPKLYKNSGVILLSGVIMCGIVVAVNYVARESFATIPVAVAGGVLYLFFLIILKAFSENEIRSLPFGNKIITVLPGYKRQKEQ